jgi:hypothetical protein
VRYYFFAKIVKSFLKCWYISLVTQVCVAINFAFRSEMSVYIQKSIKEDKNDKENFSKYSRNCISCGMYGRV